MTDMPLEPWQRRTLYPRAELREYATDTPRANWSSESGTHVMRGKVQVIHLPPIEPRVRRRSKRLIRAIYDPYSYPVTGWSWRHRKGGVRR